MWLGSSVLSDQKYWIISGNKFEFKDVNISDALLKCFDEILVNALDQYIRSVSTPASKGGPVTQIKVSFDRNSGEISIFNNGQGFDIYNNHPDLPPDQYTVEAVITREFGGSNFGDVKGDSASSDRYRVTGGINGLGIKLIVINSTKFSIETVDKIRGKYYRQEISDSMSTIHPPVVSDLKDVSLKLRQPHTLIRFTPDYATLCKKTKSKPNPDWISDPRHLELFEKIMAFRTHQLAAFINSVSYRYDLDSNGTETRILYRDSASVSFNDAKISPLSISSFAAMLPIDKAVHCKLASSDNSILFPWNIVVCLKPDNKLPHSVSQVNGVFLSDGGGSHVNWVIRQIVDFANAKFAKPSARNQPDRKKITETHIKNLVIIVDCVQIPIPQFNAQSKTSIKLATKELNAMKKRYAISDQHLAKIFSMLRDRIESEVFNKQSRIRTDTIAARDIRKYEPARKLGPRAMLFVPEGDSACKPIRDIITDKSNSYLSPQLCGTYNIQGVPPNSIKETKRDAAGRIQMSKTLENNISFKGLVSAIGLDYNKEYYHSDESAAVDQRRRKQGDAEFSKLRYGCIVIATDQDLDGIGQICSLILVKFITFWPHLVKRGFVRRLATPLIRVYSSAKNEPVRNFYSEKEHSRWVEANFASEDSVPAKYSTHYYKGLAGHTEEEVLKDIGANIKRNIFTFTLDKDTVDKAFTYYGGGKQSDARKAILSADTDYEYTESNHKNRIITCTEHFDNESREFQLDFMSRKLKHAIDGFIPSQRKAFAGARKLWSSGGAPKKVYQVTGYVTTEMHYQHGDASMNDTIIKLAQNFTGGCNLPVFTPISNGFGSRITGRDNTGSPRYINTRLNSQLTDLMFPRQDDWLLQYVYEDGEQAEPAYYVPVLPISVMETSTTVSVGWNISCWGRDPRKVIEAVRRMIQFDEYQMKSPMLLGSPWVREGMRVEVCPVSATAPTTTEVCLGKWSYNEKTEVVHVRQLPLKVWSQSYKNMLLGLDDKKKRSAAEIEAKGKELVEAVFDDTGNDEVDLKIKLKPGALDEIIKRGYGTDKIHPIEDYLELKTQMHCRLNMLAKSGKTREFQTYSEVVDYWYPERREMYKQRLLRLIIILEAQIDYRENKLRFCKEDSEKKINIDKNYSKAKREQILANAKYTRFNKTRLFNPKYLAASELRKNLYEIKASYEYIDQITVGEKSMDGIAKQQRKLDECREELEKLRRTTWQSEWLREIDELERVISEGEKTKWLFGAQQHKFASGTK
jgi:DNA gyrase/topoisomerase IV subunit B